MPDFTNQRVQELMTLGPINGIDATTIPFFVAQDKAVDMTNFVPDRNYQGFVTAAGRVNAIASALFSSPFAMAKFTRSGFPTVYAVFTKNSTVFPPIPELQYFPLNGSPVTLALPSGKQLSFNPAQFVSADKWLFLSPTGLGDTPLKIAYDTLTVTNWGIQPPVSAPGFTASGVGVLDFTGYQYTVTFGVNQGGQTVQESSPAPSAVLQAPTPISLQQAALTGIAISPDPQVNERNIYRLDSGGQFRLVGTIADNTTTTFTDNTADNAVTGQVLVIARDPPQAFFSVTNFQNSVWGFGYLSNDPATQSALWRSNASEPWGFDSANQVDAVGENAGDDIGVAVANTGTILLCLKTKTAWIVEGTPGNYTQPFFVFDIGCASARSVAQAQGTIFWLSPDPGVYAFNGGAPVYLSRDIKGFLDTLLLSDLQAAVGFYRDRCYYLSFPLIQGQPGNGVTWMYDTILQSWWKLGWATDITVFDAENQGEVTANDPNAPGIIESWFAAETDLGLPITSTVTSRLSDCGNAAATKQCRYVLVVASPQPGTGTILVTTAPGPKARFRNTVFDLLNLPPAPQYAPPFNTPPLAPQPRTSQVIQISLPGWMKGNEFQFTLSLTTTAKTQIQKISLHGWVERLFGRTG
jgi:hypothetical protein